ncbi:MAG: M18 family aminopeptidase [Pseudomonadota bacterium]|nr:M18 family aminopeptidase [Pseudomonadota bacterium]
MNSPDADLAAREHACDLLQFIDASPSPWHVVSNLARRLEGAGYRELQECDDWVVRPGGRHYVIRGGSSLIAFVAGAAAPAHAGFRLAGAHTDSPGLRLKPRALIRGGGLLRLGVEVYGGPILATFSDRDLGLAGRVQVRSGRSFEARLVHLDQPLARIANLAIHMNREVNEQGLKLHRQHELPLLLALDGGAVDDPLDTLLAQQLGVPAGQIVAWDLMVCDTQPGSLWGARQEFIAASRIDNLASTHAALGALLGVEQPAHTAVAAFFDHEEVGSASSVGAAGSLFEDVLARVAAALGAHGSDAARARARSVFISADMAHAWNPGFPAAYEPQHHLMVNGGPAIKHNVSQRYASESASVARFIGWCEAAGVPFQSYVHRSELGCGSTIGPLVASRLGIATVDVGAPMWAMHSVRESAGVLDSWWMGKALAQALQYG